jgi:hypothetical protein
MKNQFPRQETRYRNAGIKISVLEPWNWRLDATQHILICLNLTTNVMAGLTRFDDVIASLSTNVEDESVLQWPRVVLYRLPRAKPRLQKSSLPACEHCHRDRVSLDEACSMSVSKGRPTQSEWRIKAWN